MSSGIPACPDSLKPIAHFLKVAQEHDARDIVVAYWSRIYALQTGLKLSTKKPEETALLIGLMDWLETTKKANQNNESITNEVVAQAYLENYAFKLFSYADQQDRASNFGKNVVKAFYTAGMIYDVLLTFGEPSDEAQKNSKYAKWKAAYIHNCLKNGETPVPGPMDEGNEEEDEDDELANLAKPPQPQVPQPSTSQGEPSSSLPEPDQSPPTIGFSPYPNPPAPVQTPATPQPTTPDQFQAYSGAAVPAVAAITPTNVQLTGDQMIKAQKYCKWAGSALTYDDVKAAIENLQKALRLLQTGEDSG
ncbi:vacuolar protein sorting-associated protein VTA1 homolog [Bradysia coprophila]|uniref:vacuolar protein sorting-associated protein VTA1 homolog n=1 Tax=Bradysia coprophila TaxID=38358 RepID=UPI00187D9C01|nr:vacuolar protein sorting-associated protein VTA1 homolog [Bradysia coprophila]